MISLKNGRARSVRTSDEVELMLRQELSNLSPSERTTLELLLHEIQTKQTSQEKRLIDILGNAEYKTPPVDIQTFVKDPYFLGHTCDNIYPKLMDDLTELFDGNYVEALWCLHPDTPIPLLDGTTSTIGGLAERWLEDPTPFWVYSTTPEGRVVPALAEHPRKTGEDDYFKVTLDDGTHFVSNARHQMILRSGVKRMVKDMSPGDSLMPFQTKLSSKSHFVVSIEPVGRGPVYCMTVPDTANFAICTRTNDQTYTRNGVFSSNTGAIGTGKTFVASIGVCRILYELSCMKDPHASFGLAHDTNISIVCFSVNEDLARKVAYENIVTKIKASQYFQENFPFEPTKKELRFPNSVWVAPRASTDSSALGLNVISFMIDEGNFLQTKQTMVGEESRAVTIYNMIKRRMKSRFERQGRLPGMIFIVSSKNTNDDFTAKRVQESMNDPTVFVRDYAAWDVKPEDYFKSKRFWVLCGNAETASKILTDEEASIYRENIPDGVVLVDVPEDFRRDFETDLEGSIREIAGVATVSVHPFIQRREKIRDAIDKERKHPFSTLVYDMSKGGRFLWDEMVAPRQERGPGRSEFARLRPILNPTAARHIHIDIGLKKDALGLCMAHVSGWKEVIRRADDGREFVERAPIYVVDLVLRVVPPIGGEVLLSEVRHLIYDLSAHGYMITSVTLDQFQSADSIQALSAKGYHSQLVSVDSTPAPYDSLKMAFYEDRIRMYAYPPLMEELALLQEDLTGNRRKIDHPQNGSKDVADAVAASLFTLSKQKLNEPLPILKSMAYSPGAWMEEQKQASMAGNLSAGSNSGMLPAFMTGTNGLEDDWKSPWRP